MTANGANAAFLKTYSSSGVTNFGHFLVPMERNNWPLYRPFLKPLQGMYFQRSVPETFFLARKPQNGGSSGAALKPKSVTVSPSI
jgi:hypothetical protein